MRGCWDGTYVGPRGGGACNHAGILPEKRARMRRASPRSMKPSCSLGWGSCGGRSRRFPCLQILAWCYSNSWLGGGRWGPHLNIYKGLEDKDAKEIGAGFGVEGIAAGELDD